MLIITNYRPEAGERLKTASLEVIPGKVYFTYDSPF